MGGVESTPSISRSSDHVGLQNFGNTCYCNSVLQALYHCEPFREKVMGFDGKDNIITLLGDLFYYLDQKKRKASLNCLKRFILKLRKDNDLFNNRDQHDAHEFLNYMVNTVDDLLRLECNGDIPPSQRVTWVDDMFKGTLTNETKCLCCETVRRRDEDFLDLSVDIDQNTSITSSLKKFSKSELLCRESKYYCEVCCSKQEATKSLRVQKLPQILVLHLKRFKYMEHVGRFTKLSYRVAFPFELKLFNTSASSVGGNRMYDLTAVIIHCGASPHQGHYITLVKNGGHWIIYDDDIVEQVEPHTVEEFFGTPEGRRTSPSECGYILFYQTRQEQCSS